MRYPRTITESLHPLLPTTRELATLRDLGAPIEAICADQALFVTAKGTVRLVHGDPLRACAAGAQPLGDPFDLFMHGPILFCHDCQETYLLEQSFEAWADIRRIHAELARAVTRAEPTRSAYQINAEARQTFRVHLLLAYVQGHAPRTAGDLPPHVRDWRAAGLAALAVQVAAQRKAVLARWRTRPSGPTQRLVLFCQLNSLDEGGIDNANLNRVRRAAAAWECVAVSPTLRWLATATPAGDRPAEWEAEAHASGMMVDLGPARDTTPRAWALFERLTRESMDDLAGALGTAEVVAAQVTPVTGDLFDELLHNAPGIPLQELPHLARDLAAMPDPGAALGVFLQLTHASPGAAPADLVHAARGILAGA